MKRSQNNPYFAVDLDNEIITDEFDNRYSIDEFKTIFQNSTEPLDMTLMTQRLINMNYDIKKLKDFYKK